MTSAQLIRAIGAALYGSRFDADLAGALGVSRRTLRRWRNGTEEPPMGVWGDLLPLVARRGDQLDGLMEELKRRWAT